MSTIDDYSSIVQYLNAGKHIEALEMLITSIKTLSGADDVLLYERDRDRNLFLPKVAIYYKHNDLDRIYTALQSQKTTPYWHSEDEMIYAIHLMSINKSVGMLVLQFGVPTSGFAIDIEKTLGTLAGLAAYILYSEQRNRKADKLAIIISQLAEVAKTMASSDTSEEALEEKRVEETLLRKTMEAARKITDKSNKEQGISHIGLRKQRQILHPDHKDSSPKPDDRFLTVQYLFFGALSAPTEEQEKNLKERLNARFDWKIVPLDIDPATGQFIDTEQYQFGIAGYVALNGKNPNTKRIYNNIPEHIKTHGNYIPLSEISRSQLSVPMNFKDETIGVLSVEHPDINAYTEDDQENLQLLATIAASALSYIEKNSRLEALQNALKVIDEYQDKHPSAQPRAIIDIAKKILNAEAGGLYIYDAKTNKLAKFIISERKSTVAYIDPKSPTEQGMAGYLYAHQDLDFLIEDDYNTSRYRHAVYEGEGRAFPSVLKVKMRSRSADEGSQGIIGILNVDARKNRQFTVEEAKVLLSLADQAGLALTRAQAFQEQNNWRSIAKLVLDDILSREYRKVKEIDGLETDSSKSALYRIVERVLEIVHKNQALPNPAQSESGNSVSLYLYHPQSLRLQYQVVGAGLPKDFFYDQYYGDSDRRLKQPIFLDPWDATDPNFHIADDMDNDRFTKNSPDFMKNNDIRAYIAIKLEIRPHLVGVLFINFGQHYEFDDWFIRKVLEPIRQGVQAAIKYIDQQRGVLRLQKALETLSGIAQSIRHDRNVQFYDNTLQKIAEEALMLVRGNAPIVKTRQGDNENPIIWGCFSHITEYDPFSDTLIYTASYPQEILEPYLNHRLSLNWSSNEIFAHGLTARVAREAKVEITRQGAENHDKPIDSSRMFHYCRDVRKNDGNDSNNECDDYRGVAPLEKDEYGNDKILSQISIALLSAENDLLGVLTLEHVDPDPFGDEDIQLLKLFAGYAAIVIKSAQALGEREYFARTFKHEVRGNIPSIENIEERIRNSPETEIVSRVQQEFKKLTYTMSDLRWMAETLPTLMDSLWREYSLKDMTVFPIEEMFEIANEVRQLYEGEIDIQLTIQKEDQNYNINIDRYAVTHVLKNLVNNAVSQSDLVSNERLIEIRLRTDEMMLKISVLDQGKGWDPNGNQFKPLYKTINHGIGLVLSRRLIVLHGGYLDGEPNRPRGAHVWFTLPLTQNQG